MPAEWFHIVMEYVLKVFICSLQCPYKEVINAFIFFFRYFIFFSVDSQEEGISSTESPTLFPAELRHSLQVSESHI